MDFKEKYQSYEGVLLKLQEEYTNAERQAIIGETNLTNLCNQRDKLVEECEASTGVSINQVSDIISIKESELDSLMTRLSTIDISDPITQDKLDAIKSIVTDFSIVAP